MDVSRHLQRYLNDKVLAEQFADRYEGRIRDVAEALVRNRFTRSNNLELVIEFEDAWRLIPNLTQKRALVSFWGAETDDWLGQELVVYRHPVERQNADTGRVRVIYEKRVMLPIVRLNSVQAR